MEAYLEQLNPEQREAVFSTEGYVRVIAGAGSGKTRALTARYAYLVCEMGVLPANILCVTFTNKAAGEMRRRIHNLTGDRDTALINTFHGFCVTVLQEEAYAVGYPRSFMVLDNSDIDQLLRIIYEERGLTLRDMSFADARDMFEIRKTLTEPAYYQQLVELSAEELRERYLSAVSVKDILFYGYLYQEKKCFGLDYNDLIVLTLHIFQQKEDIRRKWQERLEYIMIDEFQDIDPLQVKLMEVLCAYHKNLFVVGDPDQTIYTWRGANVRFLMDFDRNFPGTKTVMMNTNYRSTPEILQVVNSLIDKNKNRIRKALTAVLPSGVIVRGSVSPDPEAEAAGIAARIAEACELGVPYRDNAVLYRAHYLTRSVEDALRKAEIPYTIYGSAGFFERAEVKDMLSYLRMLAWEDDLSFRRIVNVPKRNMGEKRLKYLEEQAEVEGTSLYLTLKKHIGEDIFRNTGAEEFIGLIDGFAARTAGKSISALLAELLDASGYERMLRTEGARDRLDNLAELKQTVLSYELGCGEECTLPDFLTHIALFTDADAEKGEDKVKLMTVHAAKGLEFPNVYLLGLNEGVFPGSRASTMEEMEEERRLAFVAMTRAQKSLCLSAVEGRLFDGSPRYMSRFLLDVDAGLIEYDEPLREELIRDSREYAAERDRRLEAESRAESFAPGDTVRHAILGRGVICEVDRQKHAYLVQFESLATPRAIAFRAKLEKEQ